MENLKLKEQKKEYPSVDLAYSLAVKSYDQMLNRLHAIDARLQNLIGFITAITAGVITIVASNDNILDFSSYWFFLAIGTYIISMILLIFGLVHGMIQVTDPNILYEKYLYKDHWTFQKDYIYFAGKGFQNNWSLINRKGHIASISSGLFLIEIIFLFSWVV